jgi:hypothetical protein
MECAMPPLVTGTRSREQPGSPVLPSLAAAFASFAAARRQNAGDRAGAHVAAHAGALAQRRAFPFAFPAALAGVDFGRTAAELDRTFRRHGARTQACSADLAFHTDKGGLAAMATFALESDRIARAVVSHVRFAPFIEGLAVTVHPRAEIDAPLLVADVMVLPPGSSRAFLDACGPSIARPGFTARFREPLAAIVDGAEGVAKTTVPAWIAPLSGGNGARLRARRGQGELLARLLVRYLDRYLGALASAEPAADPIANVADAHRVRDAFRAHGPAKKHLARSFGEPFTSRYVSLLWREDVAP